MNWTARDLLDFFEEYYGEKYTGAALGVMADYLDGHSDAFYRAAAKVLVKRYSRSWNRSPGPAEIERHMGEIRGAMPAMAYIAEPEIAVSDEEVEERLKAIGDLRRRMKSRASRRTA